MNVQLRDVIAGALYPTKAYDLPAVCERYGLESGDDEEAFSSKLRYVKSRLMKLSDEQVIEIAKKVIVDFPDDSLRAALEKIDNNTALISELTRQHISESLNAFDLSGKNPLIEFLRNYWPDIGRIPSQYNIFNVLSDDIYQHAILNEEWNNEEILKNIGFATCSQGKLFDFLEDIVHPIRRNHEEQEKIVAVLNPILRRDGYCLAPAERISGYPTYSIQKTDASGSLPADEIISKALISFDESGVHNAWQKALDRRSSDPEGAITAARTLLETVCKHIIDEVGGGYAHNDDLPKLYKNAAEHLNLAPSQHSEEIFRAILGNCQSVVGNLAGIRNKLGDSHGQGKRYVKPLPRHAELAVNLAGSMAMFLISTWIARNSDNNGDASRQTN